MTKCPDIVYRKIPKSKPRVQPKQHTSYLGNKFKVVVLDAKIGLIKRIPVGG